MYEETIKDVVTLEPLSTIMESAPVGDSQARKHRTSKKAKQIISKLAEVVLDKNTDMMVFSKNHSVLAPSIMA